MRRALACEVLVVGTGVAGVGAAIAAARAGAKTLLIGGEAVPGGVAVAGMHRSMCGLFANGKPPPVRPLNDGLALEVFRSLAERDPARGITAVGRVYVLPFETSTLVSTLLEALTAEPSLEARFGTRATQVHAKDGRIVDIVAEDEEGIIEIDVRAVVDCSGDGSVIHLAGAQCRDTPANELQLAGQSLRLGAVEDPDGMLRLRVPYQLAQGVADGVLPRHARFTQWVPSAIAGEGDLKLSVPPTAPSREKIASEDARRVHEYLKDALPELRSSRVIARSSRVVDREGRRIFGEYTLTEDDVLSARKFEDGVVRSAWPIELWDQERGPRFRYLPDGEFYEIPLRCLKVAAISNAWAAGRCISATHLAHASTRAMGTCLSLGEQAGQDAARSLA